MKIRPTKLVEIAKKGAVERVPPAPTPELVDFDKLVKMPGRVLQLGWGSVGRAMLPLVLKHLDMEPSSVAVIEKDDNKEEFKRLHPGVGYEVIEIVEENMAKVLAAHVGRGDFIIDLAVNIDCAEILDWCRRHDVRYINTSIERWANIQDEVIPDLSERTLWAAHRDLRASVRRWPEGSPTCIVTHGANPGIVSHFVKAALLDIAKAMGLEIGAAPDSRSAWTALLKRTGTKVIQIAERDTQVIDRPKEVGEFVCSWSCEGFWAEGRAPSEMGWGSHETGKPANGELQIDGRAAYLKQSGMSTLVRSWVPLGGSFNGYVIQHSEAITISQYFSTSSYAPTVYYAYMPIDAAIASVHEARGRDLQKDLRIAKDEITSGIDELGVLLLGHGKNAWWYGSQLGIDEARRLIPLQNATALQVVASMLGAIVWAIQNPHEGYCEPEDLPFDEVLKVARPYLGPIASVQSDWRPLPEREPLFKMPFNRSEPFAFENFKVP